MALLCGDGAWHIEKVEQLGVPQTNAPDGSVCVSASDYSGAIMGIDAAGITYPCPVVTASSRNQDIAYVMGTSAGSEVQVKGYAGWYVPAMDTHRTTFNGRNFIRICSLSVHAEREQNIISFELGRCILNA